MHKNSKLKRKDRMSDESLSEFFIHLKSFGFDSISGCKFLKERLKGFVCEGRVKIHEEGEVCKKSWFINEGFIIACYKQDGKELTYLIFKKGEMVLVPISWGNNEASRYSLLGTRGTHIIEISYAAVQETSDAYPNILSVWIQILSRKSSKHFEKDRLLRKHGEEQVDCFLNQYPQTKKPDKNVSLQDHWLASFLHIEASSLSRIFKKIMNRIETVRHRAKPL